MRLVIGLVLFSGGAAVAQASGPGGDGAYCGGAEGAELRVAEGAVQFSESRCSLANPVALRDMGGAVLYDGQCSGEGEAWSERIFMAPSYDGGLIMVREGFAYELARCF